MKRVNELSKLILQANDDYYNNQPTISDDEYDALKDELRELDPNHSALTIIGAAVEKTHWAKTKHQMPMGSQDKVNTIPELKEWVRKRRNGASDGEFIVQEKLDGISLSLNYKDGKLVSAITRGDGKVGENILRNVQKMKGVLQSLNEPFTGSIRGEVVLYKKVWEEHFKDFSNPRNAASGTARRITGGGQEHLNVVCYDLVGKVGIRSPAATESEKIKWLTWMGFDTPVSIYGGLKCIEEMYKEYQDGKREERPYEIDGLVIKFNSLDFQKLLGNHGTDNTGNPKGQVALKFAHEMRKSTLIDITWEVGLTGRVTPLAHIKPVKIAGALISKASLHNIGNIQKLGVKIGSEVLVSRRNDIIPYIEKSLTVGVRDIIVPDNCPACDGPLTRNGEYLECSSDDCRVEGNINKWINYMEIENVGPKTVTALVEAGLVTSPADLYALTVEEVQELDRMGERGAQRIVNGIQAKRSAPLWLFLGSLNIPNCGRRVFKNIIKAGYSLEDILQLTPDLLEQIDGIGSSKAEDVCAGIEKKSQLIEDLLEVGFKIEDEVPVASGGLNGKSFCFTGKMKHGRKELESLAISNGGQVRSVSKELDYLVIADPNSSSSKAVKARKLGVQLIGEEDFVKMVS